jgi:2'-5' RNA ligase
VQLLTKDRNAAVPATRFATIRGMRQRIPRDTRRSPQGASHNLFFALWPSDAVRAEMAAAAGQLRADAAPEGRWIKPLRYHLTLHFLGNHASIPPAFLALALAAGDAVRTAPFELVLDRAGSFRSRDIPWWLGCEDASAGLRALGNAISESFKTAGSDALDRSRLTPHVTILRDAGAPLAPTPIAPIVWPVEEFVLIDSVLGAQANYTELRRWALASPG